MCWKTLRNLFRKRKSSTADTDNIPQAANTGTMKTVLPPKPANFSLPHPEEKPDYSRNLENSSFTVVLNEWFDNYKVPEQYREFWKEKIIVTISTEIPYPAGTWEENGRRHLEVRPEWLNSGVIAHEQAHNSYALLTNSQKTEFSSVYHLHMETDSLIKLLFSQNTYGLTNDIEGHAEVYRYLGEQMPEELKSYYPRLF